MKAPGAERAANSFETVAREWYAKQAKKWAKSTAEKALARLEDGLFPWIGARPVAEITTQEVSRALRVWKPGQSIQRIARGKMRSVCSDSRSRLDAPRTTRRLS